MGGLFSKPSPPPPPPAPEPLPPPAERTSTEVATAAEAQRRKYMGATGGRAATMLTGGLGVPNDTMSRATAMLGGTART